MKTVQLLNDNWSFTGPDGTAQQVNVPHTWNAIDGQDGGNDYWRGTCTYQKTFAAPDFNKDTQCVYLEFRGVNASAKVVLNGQEVMTHDGGYSTFRADITNLLTQENTLTVDADNSVNDRVYPQKADFTFYGGIYRDVSLIILNKNHFDMDYFGGSGLAVTPEVEGADGKIRVRTWHNAENGTVEVKLLDADGKEVASGAGTDVTLTIPVLHLRDGLEDPYVYTCTATLTTDGQPAD